MSVSQTQRESEQVSWALSLLQARASDQRAGQKREVGLHRTLNMAALYIVLAAQGCCVGGVEQG